jgi:hypothetical protein
MCNMDERTALIVPVLVVLILSFCICSLHVPSFNGNPGPTARSFSMEWIEDGDKDNPNHPAGEDSFIHPEFAAPANLSRYLRIAFPESCIYPSFVFLPLLPPPIAK